MIPLPIISVNKWKNRNSYSFDGVNECININAVRAALATTTVGSWSVWASPGDVTNDGTIISFGDTDAAVLMYIYMTAAGKITCYGQKVGSGWLFTTDNAIYTTNNVYKHLLLVQNGVSPVLYVNEVLVPITFALSTNKTVWFNDIPGLDNGRIGADVWNNGGIRDPFLGKIDEVGFFNTNLSASHGSEIYNGGKPKNLLKHSAASSLVSSFRMGDGDSFDGTNWILYDKKGTNNGTSINMEENDRSIIIP